MNDVIDPLVKKCRDCGKTKPLSDYYRYSGLQTLKPMCKACFRKIDAQYKKARYARDPEYRERQLNINRSYRQRYSDGYAKHRIEKRKKHKSNYFSDLRYRCRQLVNSAKRRAERKGLVFELTPEILYVLVYAQNHKCAVTGTKLELGASTKYHRNPNAPSIDRKDSDGGYTLDNIQIVAAWYNLMKNEWSDEDARDMIHTAYHSIFKDH